MEIISFVATVSEFFLMNRQDKPNFDVSRRGYVIPIATIKNKAKS